MNSVPSGTAAAMPSHAFLPESSALNLSAMDW